MSFLPIILGISAADAEKGRSLPPKSIVEKVLKRDDFTCRYCGFRAKQYQRLVPSPEAGDPPFATACTFCEQCLMLERAGITGAGILVWLPEIAQAELNHILRAIYVARGSKDAKSTEIVLQATRALDALTARRNEAKKRLGSDDPLLLATIMHESLNDEERAQTAARLDGVRLLAPEKHVVRTSKGDVNHFPQMVAYWLSKDGPFAKHPVSAWEDMFKSASAKAGHA